MPKTKIDHRPKELMDEDLQKVQAGGEHLSGPLGATTGKNQAGGVKNPTVNDLADDALPGQGLAGGNSR